MRKSTGFLLKYLWKLSNDDVILWKVYYDRLVSFLNIR